MIIKTIRLQDFRVFSGLHEINLTPKIKYGSKAPITLFGGLNGAGKTSILTAILLTLYGRHALEDSTSLKKYHANLSKLIHHSPTQLINSNSAFTEITFSFANKGIVKDFVIKRAWAQKNSSVDEKLTITVDGKTLTAGKYGFFIIPSKEEWIVIFNTNWNQHGKDAYDAKDDVLRL